MSKVIVTRFYYTDTEYYNTSEPLVTPVCAAIIVGSERFIYGPNDLQACANKYRELNANGYIAVSYAAEAECRFMQSIGIDPLREGFRFLDLYILYRLLANKFDDIQYGKHLIKGKVKFLRKPPCKWDIPDMTAEEIKQAIGDGSQMEYGLASATYKFCNVIRDTEDKNNARERIIAGGPFTPEELQWIMNYCIEDTVHLPELCKKMLSQYRDAIPDASVEKLVGLSSYAIHTAEMVRVGYPVQLDWLNKLIENVPYLMVVLGRNLLKKCESLDLDFVPISYDRREKKFKENHKLIKGYIERRYPNCPRTDKHNVSLEEDNLLSLCKFGKVDPPEGEGEFLDFFVKYRFMMKTLKSFRPADGKRGIKDYLGSDGRVRPYFGIFGAQSSRSQPASSGFIFLKSSQLRHLVQPKPGKMIVGIDYSSQEFLINAILAGDDAMLEAYKSGDPYMYLGKNIGMIPQNGTREQYKKERNIAKEVELGLSYGMGAKGLAPRAGVPEDEAKRLIDLRANLYWALTLYRKQLKERYRNGQESVLLLPDGWAHGPDNDNDLSMQNYPTQGVGAVVMREAVRLSHANNIAVIQTLHDALYDELDYGDWAAVDKAVECMKMAFKNIMGKQYDIRVEVHCWGPDFPAGYVVSPDGKQKHYEAVTPGGNTYSYERVFWDDRVSPQERDYWHNFVMPSPLDDL